VANLGCHFGNQIKSNQIKSNQIRSDQIRSIRETDQ